MKIAREIAPEIVVRALLTMPSVRGDHRLHKDLCLDVTIIYSRSFSQPLVLIVKELHFLYN